MSAEILRRAASLMRERAEAATAPKNPWVVDPEDENDVRANRGAGPTVVQTVPLGYDVRRANAVHIASWHPLVALAVADWLDATAAENDSPDDSALGFLNFIGADALAALAVADAYLGESE